MAAAGLSAVIMLVQRRKDNGSWAGPVVSIEKYTTQDADWNGQMHSSEVDAGAGSSHPRRNGVNLISINKHGPDDNQNGTVPIRS